MGLFTSLKGSSNVISFFTANAKYFFFETVLTIHFFVFTGSGLFLAPNKLYFACFLSVLNLEKNKHSQAKKVFTGKMQGVAVALGAVGTTLGATALGIAVDAQSQVNNLTLATASGDGVSIVANGSPPNFETKGLVAGSSITLVSTGSDITISAQPTSLSSAGGSETLVATGSSSPNLLIKGLTAGSNVSMVSTDSDVTINVLGSAGVVGVPPTVTGNIAQFDNTTAAAISDSGVSGSNLFLLDGSRAMNGDISMASRSIIGVADIAGAVKTSSVDQLVTNPSTSGAGNVAVFSDSTGKVILDSGASLDQYLPLSGGTMSGNINMASHNLTSVGSIGGGVKTSDPDELVTNSGTSVAGNVATFFNTSGNIIMDSGKSLDEYLPLAGGTMSGDIDLGNHSVIGVANIAGAVKTSNSDQLVTNPSSATAGNVAIFSDTTGKVIIDSSASLDNYLPLAGGTMTGNIAMSNNDITNIASLSGSVKTSNVNQLVTNTTTAVVGHVATFSDTSGNIITDSGASLGEYLPLAGGTMTGDVDFGNHSISGVTNIGGSVKTSNVNQLVTNATTSVAGNVAVFLNTTGNVLTDSGKSLSEYLPLAGGTMSGNISMGTHDITSITSIIGAVKTSNVNQLVTNPGTSTAGHVAVFSDTSGNVITDSSASLSQYLPLAGGTMSGNLSMGTHAITAITNIAGAVKTSSVDQIVTNPGTSTAGNVAVFSDTSGNIITDSSASLSQYLPLAGGTMTGDLNMNGHVITTNANGDILIGNGATTSGTDGIAIGKTATVGGTDSIAIGRGASTNSTSSIAIGQGATSNGAPNTVIGTGASVLGGNNSTVIGSGASATSDNTVLVGRDSTGNNGSVVLGVLCTTGNDGIAIGNVCTSGAGSAYVFGNNATNSAPNSLFISNGAMLNIRSDATCALGTPTEPFNKLYLNSDVVGTSAMSVDSSGALTVGSASATSVVMGHSSAATTVNGSATVIDSAGAVTIGPTNATSTTVGRVAAPTTVTGSTTAVDSAGAVNVAPTSATSLTLGRSAAPTSLTGSTATIDSAGSLTVGPTSATSLALGRTGAATTMTGLTTAIDSVGALTVGPTGATSLVLGRVGAATTMTGLTTAIDSAGALTVAPTNATSLVLGRSGATTSVNGSSTVVDSAGAVTVAPTSATSLTLGRTAAPTSLTGLTATIDSAGSLTVGPTSATSLAIGRAAAATTITGLTTAVDSAGALTIAPTNATSLALGRAGAATTVTGLTTAIDSAGALTVGPTNATSLAIGRAGAATTVTGLTTAVDSAGALTVAPTSATSLALGRTGAATTVTGSTTAVDSAGALTIAPTSATSLVVGRSGASTTLNGSSTVVDSAGAVTVGPTNATSLAVGRSGAATTINGSTTALDSAGAVTIATTNASSLTIGRSAVATTVNGSTVTTGGNLIPSGTNTLDLGSTSAAYKNTHTNGLYLRNTGTGATIGNSQLSSGAVTVNTTFASTGARYFLTYRKVTNTAPSNAGTLYVANDDIVNGTSFVIRSSNASDANLVDWIIVQNF